MTAAPFLPDTILARLERGEVARLAALARAPTVEIDVTGDEAADVLLFKRRRARALDDCQHRGEVYRVRRAMAEARP
jgi:hypothetical protein